MSNELTIDRTLDELKGLRQRITGRMDSRYDAQMIELLNILIEERVVKSSEYRDNGD